MINLVLSVCKQILFTQKNVIIEKKVYRKRLGKNNLLIKIIPNHIVQGEKNSFVI